MTDPADIIRTHYQPRRSATQNILDRTGIQATICFLIMPFTAGMLGGITILYLTHWIG